MSTVAQVTYSPMTQTMKLLCITLIRQ